jgi:flagellar motor switch/type III secretory pathway protein FliN
MDTHPEATPSIRPYPWAALPAVARETPGALRDVRRAVAAAIDAGGVAAALSEIAGVPAAVSVARIEVATHDVPAFGGAALALATLDDAVRVDLELDSALARGLVARVLGRPVKLAHPRAALGPEVEGALSAIVLQVARRAHGASAPFVAFGHGAWRLQPGDRRLLIDASVTLDRETYAARAVVALRPAAPLPSPDPVARLSSLGRLPIALPVVTAVSLLRASEAFALAAGDIWLPGDGWTARRAGTAGHLVGDAVLAPPRSARGIGVKLGDGGEIVVVGEKTILLDVETTMPSPNQDQTATSDVVLDAPLVVRVEMGAVTLSASEWAALGPGDVVALGRRVQEPVVLRIAGTEVARGELVDIEGELGVRIRERARST